MNGTSSPPEGITLSGVAATADSEASAATEGRQRRTILMLLSAPNGHIVLYVPERYATDGQLETMRFVMGPGLFTFLVFIVGCGMRSFGWLHCVVWGMLHRATPDLAHQFEQRQLDAYGPLRTRH